MKPARASWLLFSVFLLSLISCGKQADAKLQQKLSGTWILGPDGPAHFQSRLTVNLNGRYTAHCKYVYLSNSVHTFDIEGIYQVKNGQLIDITTSHSMVTNQTKLPTTNICQIIRLTDRELVLDNGKTNEEAIAVFHREKK